MTKKVIGKQSISRGNEHKEAFIEVEVVSLDEFYQNNLSYNPKAAIRVTGPIKIDVDTKKGKQRKKPEEKKKKEK